MDFLDTYRVQAMHITQEMRQQACEGLLHFTPNEVVWVFWTPYRRSGLLSAVFFSRCEVIPQEALE